MSEENRRLNPFLGRKGWANRLAATLFPVFGPAHIGVGHAEGPPPPVEDRACPVCREPMSRHVFERGQGADRRTRMHCPAGAGSGARTGGR